MITNGSHFCRFDELVWVVLWAVWLEATSVNVHAIRNFVVVVPDPVLFVDSSLDCFTLVFSDCVSFTEDDVGEVRGNDFMSLGVE